MRVRWLACGLLAWAVAAQHAPRHTPLPPKAAETPVPARQGPLRQAQLLLREGRTEEARKELQRFMRDGKGDAETYYQYARSYLLDFYQQQEPAKRRVSLNLAMEALATVLKRNPDHIPAMKAKAIIHARAELLHYDPNLAYELSSRVAKLEPNASEFLLTVTDWMSGEVRFTAESGHRVPHDPLVGLDRSIDLLEQVMDSSMPFSNVESSSFYQMGTTLARRGNFKEAVHYFKLTLARGVTPEQRMASLREMGTAYYRMGEYEDAAATFYQALQLKMNPVDQWLLRVSMDQLRSKPPIPKQYVFERPEPSLSRTGAPLLAFEDIAPALGVNRFDGNGTCGWGDYDGDGDLDLFLAGSGTFIAVFRNDGGKFVEVTETVGLAKVPSGYSLNLIDYDNDGRTDLYISYNGWSGPMKNRLYHNEGGRFADVSAASGADDAGSGFSCMWADLDNDGWLDFAVANGVLRDGSTPQIYRNNRNGTFTNMTRQAGIDEPPTYGAIGLALGDYDRDGKVDLLINGLDPAPNRLYHNDGNWHFTEVSEKAGVIQPIHNGFVCFFFDYNNDGWPDLMTTSLAAWDAVVEGLRKGYSPKGLSRMNPDASRLFRNNKNGTFTDVTFEAGLYHPMGVMGAGVADLDNDGFVDIYFGVGDPQISRLEPNRFFRNNGDGTFSDLTDVVGFQRPGNKGHGVSFVDIDEDGDLDVYAQLGGHYPGDWAYNAFYKNLNGNQNNWLQVDLRSTKSNRNAIGAQLTVRCGEWLVYREVKGSEGFGATNQFRQHFGLGKRPKVDLIEIHWPSGVIQKIDGLDANQFIEVTEGGGWRRLK